MNVLNIQMDAYFKLRILRYRVVPKLRPRKGLKFYDTTAKLTHAVPL